MADLYSKSLFTRSSRVRESVSSFGKSPRRRTVKWSTLNQPVSSVCLPALLMQLVLMPTVRSSPSRTGSTTRMGCMMVWLSYPAL